MYSTLIGDLWHCVLEREQKTSLVSASIFLPRNLLLAWVIGQLSLFDTSSSFSAKVAFCCQNFDNKIFFSSAGQLCL